MIRRLARYADILFSAAIVALGIYVGVIAAQRNAWLFASGSAIQTDVAHLDWEFAQRHVVELSGRIECDEVLAITRKTTYMNTPVEEKTVAWLYPFHDASSPRRIYVRFNLPLEHAVPCGEDTRVRGVWRAFSHADSLKAVSAQQGTEVNALGPDRAWMTLLLPHPDVSGAIEIAEEDRLAGYGDLALYGLAGPCVMGVDGARLYRLFAGRKELKT